MNISVPELFSLVGRVALVTGASGDIGCALAEGLAAAGATLALHGRSAEKLTLVQRRIEHAGGTAAIVPLDLNRDDAASTLRDAVVRAFGRVDILVNCAGINQRMPINEMTPVVYDHIMATNLRSLYFLTQAIVPSMIAAGGGKIINVGSITSTIGLGDVSVYGMTKSALSQLTKTMAIEWAAHNIQANCLCPGFIATELTTALWDDAARRQWMLDRLPIKRPGSPADLVGLAIYLAAPASNYTTGQTMYVDGGFLAGSQW